MRGGRTKCNTKSFTKEELTHMYAGFATLQKYQTCHIALQLSNFFLDELPSQSSLSMVIMKFPLLNKLHRFEKDTY